MATVTAAPKGAKTAELTKGVAAHLTPVVIDLMALAVEGKQAHWHVRGVNFMPVHELLDALVDHAREFSDLAAERIVTLGQPLDARVATIGATTTVPAVREGFQSTDALVAEVIAGIDATLVTLRSAIDELDEIDPVSQDLAIAITAALEKDRWFLFAHIAA
ncbi:Dps family protein [Microcella sp.]|uniref:Dps family protein n=1 Tax=Microcella sp. TaxID=1913979 RepID=UPI00391AF1CF